MDMDYGLIEYTKFLIDNGISFFAVATTDEAIQLRNAGIKEEIIMLSSTTIKNDIEKLIDNNIIVTVGSKQAIEIVNEIGKEKKKKIRAHLAIDTGFGRYGFVYLNRDEIVEAVKMAENVKIEGTFSHFSISYYNDKYTKTQFDRFMQVIEVLQMNGINTGILHICNSSAMLKFSNMHLNAVRVGSGFIGRVSSKDTIGLKKIAFLESQVAEIKHLPKGFNVGYSNIYKTKKEMDVAIVPCGYIDGFNVNKSKDMFRKIDKLRYIVNDIKALFKKQSLYVKIDNTNCKILGTVGTYHITCDITGKEIKTGDKAIFQINPRFIDSRVRREYR